MKAVDSQECPSYIVSAINNITYVFTNKYKWRLVGNAAFTAFRIRSDQHTPRACFDFQKSFKVKVNDTNHASIQSKLISLNITNLSEGNIFWIDFRDVPFVMCGGKDVGFISLWGSAFGGSTRTDPATVLMGTFGPVGLSSDEHLVGNGGLDCDFVDEAGLDGGAVSEAFPELTGLAGCDKLCSGAWNV